MGRKPNLMSSLKAEMTVKQVFDEFVRSKRALNCSDSTLCGYRYAADRFMKMLPSDMLMSDVCKSDYDDFVLELQNDQRKGQVTRQTYCRNLLIFLHWCMENEYCDYFKAKLPRAQAVAKQVYTDEEIAKLLEPPKGDVTERTYITWVFENLLFSTGLRISSAVNLRVEDVQGNQLYIRHTKNRQPLVFTLNPEVTGILKKYIKLFQLAPEDFLFCSGDGDKYKKNSMQKYVRAYNLERGVEKTSCHLMRHTYAKNFYMATRDIFALQKIMTHSDLSTTQKYLRSIGVSEVQELMVAWNPQAEIVKPTARRRGRMKTA